MTTPTETQPPPTPQPAESELLKSFRESIPQFKASIFSRLRQSMLEKSMVTGVPLPCEADIQATSDLSNKVAEAILSALEQATPEERLAFERTLDFIARVGGLE